MGSGQDHTDLVPLIPQNVVVNDSCWIWKLVAVVATYSYLVVHAILLETNSVMHSI